MILVFSSNAKLKGASTYGFMWMIRLWQRLQKIFYKNWRDIKSQYKITVKYDVETYLGVKFENLPGRDVKSTQPKFAKESFQRV